MTNDAVDDADDDSDFYSESTTTRHSGKRKLSFSTSPSTKRHKSGDFIGSTSPSQASLASRSPFESRSSSRQTTGFAAPSGLYSRPCSIPQPPRNAHDAKEARAFRCGEIERRCRELAPPISPSTLQHLEAYRAASVISAPLTESAWAVLLPRLQVERNNLAEQQSRRGSSPLSKSEISPRPTTKELKAANASDWEASQKPVRDRLERHATSIIVKSWSNGQDVNYENCPRFGAEVLLKTRSEFLQESNLHGLDSSLLMDNMKWIHDQKVKPITSQHRKEIFLCNGCEAKTRYYAFDGIVQHYAAKHTNAMSSGNIVVAWQLCQWPEDPPFAVDPDSHKLQAGRKTNTPSHASHTPYDPKIAFNIPPQPGNMVPGPLPVQPIRPFGSQPLFAPSMNPSIGGQTSPFDRTRPFWIAGAPTSPPAYGGFLPPSFSSSPNTPFFVSTSASSVPNLYQSQVDAVANIAHQIWSSISHIKSASPSIRMYTIIMHVLSHFRSRFSNEPGLELFRDAVINHPLMIPMKDVTGFSCAACVSEQQRHNPSLHSLHSRSAKKKTFLFHSLLTHFQIAHAHVARSRTDPGPSNSSRTEPRLDWKKDMIDLPPLETVAEFLHTHNMDPKSLEIFMGAFPDVKITSRNTGQGLDDSRKPTFVDASELHKFQPHSSYDIAARRIDHHSASFPLAVPNERYRPITELREYTGETHNQLKSHSMNENTEHLRPKLESRSTGERYTGSYVDGPLVISPSVFDENRQIASEWAPGPSFNSFQGRSLQENGSPDIYLTGLNRGNYDRFGQGGSQEQGAQDQSNYVLIRRRDIDATYNPR